MTSSQHAGFVDMPSPAPVVLDDGFIEKMDAASSTAKPLAPSALAERAQGRLPVRPGRFLLLTAIPATAGTAVFLWLCATLGDPIVAAILLGTILVQVLAIIRPGNRR